MPSPILTQFGTDINLMLDRQYLHGSQTEGTPFIKELFQALVNSINGFQSEVPATAGAKFVGTRNTGYTNFTPATNDVDAALAAIDLVIATKQPDYTYLGSGVDGAFNSVGPVTLGGEYNYTNFTLNVGHVLTIDPTIGWVKIRCQGILTINGTIVGSGANCTINANSANTLSVGGVGCPSNGGDGGLMGRDPGKSAAWKPFVAFGGGGAGGSGNNTGAGFSTTPYVVRSGSDTYSNQIFQAFPYAGHGGDGASSQIYGGSTIKGKGGQASPANGNFSNGLPGTPGLAITAREIDFAVNRGWPMYGGGGGGGGGGDDNSIPRITGAGGGGGGGCFIAYTNFLVFGGAATIDLHGGNGANGAFFFAGAGGPGGGGGGGSCVIAYKNGNLTGTIPIANVTGGAAGAPSGFAFTSAGNAAAGANGVQRTIVNN